MKEARIVAKLHKVTVWRVRITYFTITVEKRCLDASRK